MQHLPWALKTLLLSVGQTMADHHSLLLTVRRSTCLLPDVPQVPSLHICDLCLDRSPAQFTRPLSGSWSPSADVCGATCTLLRHQCHVMLLPPPKCPGQRGHVVLAQSHFTATVSWGCDFSHMDGIAVLLLTVPAPPPPRSLWGERLWGFCRFAELYIKMAKPQTECGLTVSGLLSDLLTLICKFYLK